MSKLKYAMQGYDEKTMSRARLNNSAISRKISIEIFNMIRYKSTEKAKMLLEEVMDMKRAVPYKKFNRSVAHKTGIGPGRYPIKAVDEVLKLIKLAEANAQNKGLSSSLVIKHLAANKGNMQWHHGRQSRRQMKSTHIEIVVLEKTAKKEESKHKKEEKTFEKKAEVVKHEEKTESKKEAPEEMPESKLSEHAQKQKKPEHKAKSLSKPKTKKSEVKKE